MLKIAYLIKRIILFLSDSFELYFVSGDSEDTYKRLNNTYVYKKLL